MAEHAPSPTRSRSRSPQRGGRAAPSFSVPAPTLPVSDESGRAGSGGSPASPAEREALLIQYLFGLHEQLWLCEQAVEEAYRQLNRIDRMFPGARRGSPDLDTAPQASLDNVPP